MDSEEQKPHTQSLRTYKGDIEEAVAHGESTASIYLAEQKRKGKDLTILDPEAPIVAAARNKFFAFLGGALLILGLLTIGSIYYIHSQETVVVEQKTKSLIAFSKESEINISNTTKDTLSDELVRRKNTFTDPVNSVLFINTLTSNNTASPESLFSILAPRMPSALVRSLAEKYMIGVYSFDTNEIFFILTINDYATSYANMLKWEKDMVFDIGGLFNIADNPDSPPNFVDKELKNKDLRVLTDMKGKTILVYSFIDKNTLVITKNENILNAIIQKYLLAKQER